MLAKNNRLRRSEIEEIKRGSKFVLQGKFFGLIFKKQAGKNGFALIISNKVAAKASERNRIKRLLFKAIEKSLLDKEGRFLFLAKKTSIAGNLETFTNDLLLLREKLVND